MNWKVALGKVAFATATKFLFVSQTNSDGTCLKYVSVRTSTKATYARKQCARKILEPKNSTSGTTGRTVLLNTLRKCDNEQSLDDKIHLPSHQTTGVQRAPKGPVANSIPHCTNYYLNFKAINLASEPDSKGGHCTVLAN